MDFNTKEDYDKFINNMYMDNWKEVEPAKYTKSDKFYMYPNYSTFEKEYSEAVQLGKLHNDLMIGLVMSAILAQMDKKPIEELTSDEKMGICIGAGIPVKYENGRFTTTYNVGFALIDDKYNLFYNIDPFNTYC